MKPLPPPEARPPKPDEQPTKAFVPDLEVPVVRSVGRRITMDLKFETFELPEAPGDSSPVAVDFPVLGPGEKIHPPYAGIPAMLDRMREGGCAEECYPIVELFLALLLKAKNLA